MSNLLLAVRRLETKKKIVLAVLAVVVILTWLGVCAVLATYLG